jgi:hypothetical protein
MIWMDDLTYSRRSAEGDLPDPAGRRWPSEGSMSCTSREILAYSCSAILQKRCHLRCQPHCASACNLLLIIIITIMKMS